MCKKNSYCAFHAMREAEARADEREKAARIAERGTAFLRAVDPTGAAADMARAIAAAIRAQA